MTAIQAIHHIWHKDEKIVPGTVITAIEERTAKRLVEDGAAFFVNIPIISEIAGATSINNLNEDYKALDEEYTLDELKEMAATVEGLEFKGNISKKDLINLIIESEKVDAFFAEEE